MKALYPEKTSSELMSQTMSKDVVNAVLWHLNRKVLENYSVHWLTIEAWAVGVRVYGPGVRGGVISYKDLAKILRKVRAAKAEQLPIQRKGKSLYLVGSFQGLAGGWHAVMDWGGHSSCDCLLFGCWNKRMRKECPELFKALNGDLACHHIVAVESLLF
jgi:hypothetical protein